MYFTDSPLNPETQIHNLSAGILLGKATPDDVKRVVKLAADNGHLPLLREELEKVTAILNGLNNTRAS